jgi:fucose permease
MIIACGTIVSSLMSDKLTKKIGAGLVTALSVSLTAAALFGFSVSHSFIAVCIWAVPYGLGAGAVDAALNNFVALHYASRHMNWLHCFWGVGAAVSPYIMSYCLTKGYGWNSGYRVVSIIQIVLSILIFISLPLWKSKEKFQTEEKSEERNSVTLKQAFKIQGVPYILSAFFAYCALEQTAMLWASSYLVQFRGTNTAVAAKFASLFLLGITFGRFLSGFISDKIGDKNMIRIGTIIALSGIVMIFLPVKSDIPALSGLIITGLGCAPVYPAIIHSTPQNVGKENSQAVIGIQMASAYLGTTFMPPLFGLIAKKNIGFYPFYLLIFAVLLLIMSEMLNKKKKLTHEKQLIKNKQKFLWLL